jgi:hypothetical protein
LAGIVEATETVAVAIRYESRIATHHLCGGGGALPSKMQFKGHSLPRKFGPKIPVPGLDEEVNMQEHAGKVLMDFLMSGISIADILFREL